MERSEVAYITLPHKPSARITAVWSSNEGSPGSRPLTSDDVLVVFLNGLMTTLDSWKEAVAKVVYGISTDHRISLLRYDRYGQGNSDQDPVDADSQDPSHGHDLTSSIEDLRHLIIYFSGHHDSADPSSAPRIIFVCNSIGCAIGRLYAQIYPFRVAGLIFLDSIIANSNIATDVFPDPDDASFDLSDQPEGVTKDNLRRIREKMARIFDPSVGSKEGLSRRNLQALLPSSDSPALVGWPPNKHSPLPKGPYLTIVSHGFQAFADQSASMSGTDPVLTLAYMNPFWWKYHESLIKITEGERAKGPIEAVGAGHFVQKDRPDLVAQELVEMIEKVKHLSPS